MSEQHTGEVAYLLGQHQRLLNGGCSCGLPFPDGQRHRLHVAEALSASGLAQDPAETVAAFLGAARGSLDAERIDRAVAQRVMNRLLYGNPEGKDLVRLPCGSCAVSCQGVCKK